jgi:hypothetical protein
VYECVCERKRDREGVSMTKTVCLTKVKESVSSRKGQ